jgi:hypothetical protein
VFSQPICWEELLQNHWALVSNAADGGWLQ